VTELQIGRYDRLLRRVGDLKGPGSKVNDVLEELFPVFDVENLPGELYRLAAINLCFGGAFLGAVVAQAGRFQLFNPVGSGKLVTITSARLSPNGVAIVRWGISNSVFGVDVQTQVFRDARDFAPDQPTAQVRTDTSVALATATQQSRVLNNTAVVIESPNGVAVLPPGRGFEIGSDLLNADVSCAFEWRERVAEPSELIA